MPLITLFLSGIILGFAYVAEKKLALKNYHPATLVFLIALVSTIIGLPLLLYQFKVPTNPGYWLLTLVSVATYGIGNMYSFKAYKSMDASAVGLINRFNIVLTAIIGIVFLGEAYLTKSYLGLILIFAGSLATVYEKGKFTWNRGVVYSLIMALGYALSAVFDKVLLGQFSPFTYVVVNNFLVALTFSFYGKAKSEAVELIKRQPILVLLAGFLAPVSWVGFLYVLQTGSVSKVFPIFDSSALVSTVILGIILLKETDRLYQKIIGGIAVILGVFILG